ncbi:hypothetical protein SAMN04244548_03013 [Paracoccus pantotrophus]|nr:hypothetical protein SAMN04244548_03013 [Paracoccus pantotrophus]
MKRNDRLHHDCPVRRVLREEGRTLLLLAIVIAVFALAKKIL